MEPPSFPAGGPQVLRATPGSDAGLVIPLPSGSPPFQFEWSRAGAKLSERFTSSHNAGGVRLSISAARTGDSGVYTLQASNAAGKDTTRVRVEVSPDEMPTGDDPPTFLRRLQDLTVKVGTRTRFLVEIVSSTECRVTWYRNERRLMEAERIALVRDGNFWCADISAVSVDDAGRWTCTAENIGGRASCSAHLNVLVPKAYKRPEFVEELRALLTEQGTVSLECKVVGVPTPVLRWFKDSREIKAGDVFALTANAEDPTSLGTYTCEAVNCMGRAYSSSKVQVIGRASREGSMRPSSGGVMLEPPPIFTKELEDQFVRICDRLTLSCQIVVPPWPRTVVWYNKEGKVESSDKYHILEDGVGGYFIEIQTSEFPDEGEWKCVATSAGGRVGISTCYVSMDIPKNYRKPRFMENLQAVLTDEGLVSFECKVVGFPTPVLSWFKDGQELKPGDVYQLTGTNSLGSYCCIARNFMGQASSSAELTVEDIQNQLNEEEKLQLFSKNQAPKYLQGLKSVEAKIDEPFRFTIKVAIPPEPTVLWYRDEQPVDESSRCHLGNEESGSFFLDIQNLEFMDQAEWKCVAMNDYGQSVTSCFLKLVIPRHYKKPRFLENLQAILSDEGAVNLECKVIGVPQPVLKWYKDGEELKPGDIHRIISGQDGTCCLGTYTCEAQNCMGIAASSASLLGFEDSLKAKNKKKTEEQTLQRNLSLSTIHEERTSQMYDTPVGDITLDDKGEISFSFDGKEVSVSLYETPDLTEEEALQIVEMYADQLSENVTEHNVVELPPLRFVKETSTSGNLLMEAIIIDVSPEYFTSPEEDLRTEADIEDISIADENGPPQLSLDQDLSGEDYLEKTMALLSEERADVSKKIERKKSDSQKSVDDYFSLSRDRSSSEEKKDDETQALSESDLQSFASAHSAEKLKSKSSKPSIEDGQESSDITKTVLLKEDLKAQFPENSKDQTKRRGSHGSRRSISSEKSPLVQKEVVDKERNKEEQNKFISENIKTEMMSISSSLTKVMNAIQIIERDIILKSELMSVAATASRSLEIIISLITPLTEIHSITDTITETESDSPEIICSLFNRLPQSLGKLEQALTIVEKCIDYESDNKTLVKKTCVSLIETCGDTFKELMTQINTIAYNEYTLVNDICMSNIKTSSENILKTLKCSEDACNKDKILNETIEDQIADISLESKHLHHTQKVLYALKSSLKSVLSIIGESDVMFKSIPDIKNAQIILDEISTPIQELQNALEQVETLSVAESDSMLPKYNTEIIESVINYVLKLRTAFEQLSTDKEKKINEVLLDITQNIHSISSQLELFEEKNGKFDILHNDNKLEVLQTMAQTLISLENSLPILDTTPYLKTNMSVFHQNLTKVLENVIEGNDSTKYFTLLEICSAVSRINTSLNNMESRQMASLAIISNTLKIIQRSVHKIVFEDSLNKSLLKNINDILLDIQETINQVEESTLNVESEKVEDLSIKIYEKNKLITVLEHVQKTIASMSNVVSFENVENLPIAQVFENINPILTEIQCCVACLNVNTLEHSDNVSDMTVSSFTEAIAHPLCELHQNITVLNEVLCEVAKNHETTQFTAFAEPLIELQTTLEILQAEVFSQYEEILQCPEILGSIANSVHNLQSCIVKIQEHDVLEFVDDMSTLDDISGIKTTADILLPTDQFDTILTDETLKIEEIPIIRTNAWQPFAAQGLQTIKENILSLQNSVIAKKVLSDEEKSLPVKSLFLELELISSEIQNILQPINTEVPQTLSLSSSKLTKLIEPLEYLQERLSIVSEKNIVFENFGDITQIQIFNENILNLKASINEFSNILQLALEAVNEVIYNAIKNVALRQLPEKLDNLLSEYSDFVLNKNLKMELTNLHTDILNALDTNLSNNNKAEVNEIIEKVNKSISKVQDEGFVCTAQNCNILSHESNLVKTLSELEQCIAALHQSDFPEKPLLLTSATDNEPSQIAIYKEEDPIIHLDQIIKIVNTTYNESNEGSESDINLTDKFFDTFTKEISLLRYLIKNHPSSKQIIKLIQVFYALLSNLNDYKSQYDNTLSDDFNKCLKISLCDIESSLKNIKTILVQIIHYQSQLLFDIPKTKIIEDEQFLKNILQSQNSTLYHTTYSVFLKIIELSKSFNDNLKYKMIEELSTYEDTISQKDDPSFNNNYDYLASFLTTQGKSSLDNPLQQITEKLIHVIEKHKDVKDIIGVGKNIIFMQCISDCVDILKECSVDALECSRLMEKIKKCISKETNIDDLLLEISEPLDSFCKQMINIRNKIILASDIDFTELKSLESHTNAIRKINENIALFIDNNELDNHDVALPSELKNKCSLILNTFITLEDTPIFDAIKEVVKPIEEIEKNLNLIISYNQNLIDKKSQNNKEKAEALLQQMEQHIEIIEIVEEVSAVIRLDDLKETASIVKELRDSIERSESAIESSVEEFNSIITDQIPLTDKLQKALISLQSQLLMGAQQDTVNVKEDKRQQIIDAVSDLQSNLIELKNIALENKPENVNNTQIGIVQEENNISNQINSDRQDTDCIAEQSLNLSKNNDDLPKLIHEEPGIQKSGIKGIQVVESYDSKYNLSSNETFEDAYDNKPFIDILMENIQKYLRQDIIEVAKEFSSSLNYEAVKITQDILLYICQNSDISNCVEDETTGSLLMSDDQLKIICNLHKNLESILTYEPAKELEEVVAEDKLLQFKIVAKNLYETIQNLNISSITTVEADKSQKLAIASPKVIEPKIEGPLSENLVLSCIAEQNSNDIHDNLTDYEVLLRQKDSEPKDLSKNVNDYSTSGIEANVEEVFGAGEEKLVHYIKEFVSEEVMEILKQTLPTLSKEHLEKSLQISNQFCNLCKVTNFKETNNLLKEKLELTIQLNESIISIHNEIFEIIKCSPTLFEYDKLQKIKSVLKNLVDILETYITSEQNFDLEKVIALNKSKPVLTEEPLHKIEQTVENTDLNADLVFKAEESNILSINKEDDEICLKIDESSLIDKSDDSLITNEVIESKHLSTDHEIETNSIQILEQLLKEVNDDIDLFLINVDNSELIQNNLDEVQSVIIKLKCDFDGAANDALNETLEDLECNVRSVQLQINEQSPPVLLKEECSNLQVIVACLKNIEEVKETALVSTINIVNNCTEEADQTIQLLNKACCSEANSKVDGIISCLNNVKDIMKSLRICFVDDTETLILKGIDVIQKLDQVEDTIFSLEKDVDKTKDIDVNIKDNIITAMHSVYGSISNMRGAVSSIQKRYMYEKYGKPSQNFLKSIKNISDISHLSIDNKSSWKNCAKFFRKVLNHFEDIKFYINFDRTARIPNDAAFTKIILLEIVATLNEVQKLHEIKSEVSDTIDDLKTYVNNKNFEIEERTTLEVKDKIPIFIDLSVKILEATEAIKWQLQSSIEDLNVAQLMQIDDETTENRIIGQSKEVQQIYDINKENAELVTIHGKEIQELVKVTIGDENVLQKASKMDITAEDKNLLHCQDHQMNDVEQLNADQEQGREEIKSKEVDILQMSSEGSKERDIVIEKGIELQENTSQCVQDENYKSAQTFTDSSNVIPLENITTEKQNIRTEEELRDSQPVSEALINLDKCELLTTKAEVETILKIEEDYNTVIILNSKNASVTENQQSDILRDTLEANTSREPVEQIIPHTIVSQNIQINEHKGKMSIIENSFHIGLLTNNNLDINDKNSNIENHYSNQSTDTIIENLNIQENQTLSEIQPVDDKETENKNICGQSPENILLKKNENYDQHLTLTEGPAISEKSSNDVINNQNTGEKDQIVNKLSAGKEEPSLSDEKNIQETETNKCLNDINKKDDVMDPKDLPKNTEKMENSEVSLNKNTDCNLTPLILQDIVPLEKKGIPLTKDTTNIDSVCDEKLKAETGQDFPKELSSESVTQREVDIINIEDSQQSSKRININEINSKKDMIEGKEKTLDHSKIMTYDDSQFLENTLNKSEIEELMSSSITERIEGLTKTVEQASESILISGVNEGPKEIDIIQIDKPEQFDKTEGDLTANKYMKEKYSNAEDKTTVTEISGKDSKKNDHENKILKNDVQSKNDDNSIGNGNQKELVKYTQLELADQNVFNESIEKDIPKPEVIMESDLENKKTTESITGNKEATEVNLENRELIDIKSHKGDKKSSVRENGAHESVIVLESVNIQQSDNIEVNFPANTNEKNECSVSEHKAMVTGILEIGNKEDDQESITLKKHIINKDDVHPICQEKPGEFVNSNQTESADQLIFNSLKEKDIQKSEVILELDQENNKRTESNSDNKEATEIEPENKEKKDANSHKGHKKTPVEITGKNESGDKPDIKNIQQLKGKEQYNNTETNFPPHTNDKKEYLESEHAPIVTGILETSNKKDNQEDKTLKKDDLNKDDVRPICKEKQEELVKCNQPESTDQIIYDQSIEKYIQKPEVIVESDVKNNKITESKLENKEVIDATSHTGDKKTPITKNGENESINILESQNILPIKEKEQSNNTAAISSAEINEKKEYPESEHKFMVTEILETVHKKNEQESITLIEDVINKDDVQIICNEKQIQLGECKQPESTDQNVYNPSIKKDIQKPEVILESDLENKDKTESKSGNKEATVVKHENKEVIDCTSYKDDKKTPLKKSIENESVNMFESQNLQQIREQETSNNTDASFSAHTIEIKEYSEPEHKLMVTEILETVNEKDDKESVKQDVRSNSKEKQKEMVKRNQPESTDQLIFNQSIDNDIQEPEPVIMGSDLETKNTPGSDLGNKETTEVKTENKEVINAKSHKGDKKTPIKKNRENESVNIFEGSHLEQIKEKERSDNAETNIPDDKKGRIKYSESEQKTMVTETDSKKDDQDSITLKKYILNKDDDEDDKSVKCNRLEADMIFKESIEKDKRDPDANAQLDLENKESIMTKCDLFDEKATVQQSKEKELVTIIKETDVDQIRKQGQSDICKDNFTDKIVKEKHVDYELKDIEIKIIDKSKDHEENKNFKDVIDAQAESTIHKEKQEELFECNKIKSDSQVIFLQPKEEEKDSSRENLQSVQTNIEYYLCDENPSIKKKEENDLVNNTKDPVINEIKEQSEINEKIFIKDTIVKEEYLEPAQRVSVAKISKKDTDEENIILNENDTGKYRKSSVSDSQIISSESISKEQLELQRCQHSDLDNKQKKEDQNEIKEDKQQSNKNKEDAELMNVHTIENDESMQINAKDMIIELSEKNENNLDTINETNNIIEKIKSKKLKKGKDGDSIDIKTSEINNKKEKKKQKSDQKHSREEIKESNEEKNILVKDENNILFKKPIQMAVNEEPSNVINTENSSLSIEEYKSRSVAPKKYIKEDITSSGRDTAYSNTTKEYFTNTEQNEKKEYSVYTKSNVNTYEKIDPEKEKCRPKESPIFIDHNTTDYLSQFPRPPNYTSKSVDNEELISSDLNLLNRAPIYKAETLMNEYRTRTSYSPQIEQTDQISHSYGERAFTRCRSKAVSESRSATSEKRTTRDLKRKPVFSTFLTDRTAVESSRVKLTCSILSSGEPTITWYKNGSLLNDKNKFRSKFIDGLITLEVLNAIPNDSGEYSCTVGNEYGSITSSANLKVYPSFEASPIPPTFTRSIRDVYHSFENELILECRIRGQPLPSITWYKDDKPIALCERYQAHYLADGVCRLIVSSPSKEDSGKYTCHAESSIWSDQIYHNVQFNEKERCVSPNILTLEKVRLNRQVLESRKPHFTNVISDYKVVSGGTIGLQVEIKGSPTRVEWLREGCSVTDTYRNAQTYVDHGIYTLALTDVTEKESGLYTCRAWSSHGNVDMNASIIVVQPNQIDGKPAVIVSRPTKDVHISIGEDINISFRVQGEPKAKVIFMKGLRDITHSQRVCKMTSDDYIKFTLKRSVVSDAGTYCILARNAYGCDRAFVTVVIKQRASSENLISDWTYPMDDLAISGLDRNYKAVPDRIPSEPSVVDGGKNWVSLAWPKPDCQTRAPILAYKIESWLIGKEGGARWTELGITPRNSFDAFNLKQEEEYHFRVTPRNRYGWGESVQTSSPIGIGLTGDRPEFIEILPGQLKVLLGETATLCCTFKGKPTPEILWLKNGHDIEEDANRVKITLSSFKACLNIENVKIEDEGRYSCEASNIHGRSSTYARMTVIKDRSIWEADAKLKRERSSGVDSEYPPQFTMRLRDRRVQATYPVRLTCQVVGSPAPVVTWFKNGEEVSNDGRHTMSQDEYFYTLEIAPTTLDDGGVYEAMARNSSGAISCHCSLVVDKGIRAYVAPEFCCGLEPLYQLKEGEELRISAIVEAYPSVGVSWYRDGVRLRPSRRAIMTLDRDGQIELALASVTARDAGVYTCTASNEVGRVSTSGKVEILGGESGNENVHAPPIFVSDESTSALYSNEPRFLRKPRSSEAREGDTVIIECEVIGDPKPEVYWLRDFLKPDYYRDANHFKRVGAGPEYRFEIPHAKFDYTGAYSVIAKNIHGEAKAIISLQILARDPNSSQEAHNIRYGRVEVIPRFEKELTDLLCYDGDVIEFECRVTANPEPDIRWFHYSEMVPDCLDFESSYHRGIARLKIKQVTAEDEGTFRCEASNSLGKATSSACLVVYPPGEPNTLSQRLRRPPVLLSGASTPRSTPRTTPRTTPARSLSATPGPDSRRLYSPSREIAPKFYTYPFNRVAEEGDTVVFQCAVKGLPPPWATWDKDGIIITASSRITIREKDEMFRILEIEQVNIEDVGLYRITLENDYGRAEASARLEVISGKGKFHGTRSYSASPSRRALTYRRRTPSFSRQD